MVVRLEINHAHVWIDAAQFPKLKEAMDRNACLSVVRDISAECIERWLDEHNDGRVVMHTQPSSLSVDGVIA